MPIRFIYSESALIGDLEWGRTFESDIGVLASKMSSKTVSAVAAAGPFERLRYSALPCAKQ